MATEQQNNEKTKKRRGNPQNLKPCKPGETHNPHGRPKGRRTWSKVAEYWTGKRVPPKIRAAVATMIQDKDLGAEELEGLDLQDMAVLSMLKAAIKGNPKAFTAIRDTMDGRPKERLQVDGQLDTTVRIVVNKSRKGKKPESG